MKTICYRGRFAPQNVGYEFSSCGRKDATGRGWKFLFPSWSLKNFHSIFGNNSESRFCTVEEAKLRCPQDIRLFNTNNSVNEYNNKILNADVDRITSTAKDLYIGCTSKEQETFVRQKLHKMSLIDTNGLPYQTVYVNIYDLITTNIDVADGLANGAVGKLVHVEKNDERLVERERQYNSSFQFYLK
ncbi:ATP-dependent DNA helicase [Trichonephila clavipes]|nr:ATP-dependent DNA helicase [Trichonephila clavipes]